MELLKQLRDRVTQRHKQAVTDYNSLVKAAENGITVTVTFPPAL